MRSSSNGKPTALSSVIVLIIMGIIFFVVGTVMPMSYGNKGRCKATVSAEVIEMTEHRSSGGVGKKHRSGTSYAPVFQYEYEGQQYTVYGSVATNPPEYYEGEQVMIRVNPDAPREIYYEPRGTTRIASAVFKLFGVAAVVGGIILIITRFVKKGPEIPKLGSPYDPQ